MRRNIKTKKYDLQHDDIWIQEANGKRRRLLQGDKFNRGDTLFSYAVDAFRWSPNGRMFLAQLFTTSVVDEGGRTEDSSMTLAFEDGGKEIHFGNKGENLIKDCFNATWLLDNATIIYFEEAIKPHMLFSFRYTNISTGPAGLAFEGRTFIDSDRIPRTNAAIAVEQDRTQSGPPRLQRLELLAQDDKEVATLDSYAGGLSVSPSGKKVAYFIDKEVLEVRDLAAPDHFVRLRVGLGVFHWSADENRIMLKRAVERKSGDLCLDQHSRAPRAKTRQCNPRRATHAATPPTRPLHSRIQHLSRRPLPRRHPPRQTQSRNLPPPQLTRSCRAPSRQRVSVLLDFRSHKIKKTAQTFARFIHSSTHRLISSQLLRPPPMLHQNASILHHYQSRRPRPLRSGHILNTQLHPNHLGPYTDRALYDRRHIF